MRVAILVALLSFVGCSTIRDWIDTLPAPTPRPEPTATAEPTPSPEPTATRAPTARPPTPVPPAQTPVPPGTGVEWRSPRDGNGGFLWKPQADNTPRTLVVLLPPEFNGVTATVELHRAQPPTAGTLIERGRYTGIANGNRGHWRYTRPGADYGANVVVLVWRDNGSRVGYVIPSGAERVD